MRSGLFTSMLCANGFDLEVIIRRQRLQMQSFIRWRLCSKCGGIIRLWCILWSNQGKEQSLQMCTVGNWTEAVMQKRPKLASRKRVVFRQDNTRSYTSFATHSKVIGAWIGCVDSPVKISRPYAVRFPLVSLFAWKNVKFR